VQIFLDFGAIRFQFHDQISQWSISFQSVTPGTTQDDKRSLRIMMIDEALPK
jgi:hypothetical protein